MPQNDINLTVGLTPNMGQMNQAVNGFVQNFKQNPIQLTTAFPNVNVGNAQEFLNTIQQTATAIDNITTKQAIYVDENGAETTRMTQLALRYKDALGETIQETRTLFTAEQARAENLTKIGEREANAPLGKISKEVSDFHNKQSKAFDAMDKKATDYNLRAENWGRKEKEALQESVRLLKAKTAEYNQAKISGDLIRATQLIPEVNALNAAFEKQVSLAKMAAGAISGWGAHLANAIKQTITYTFTIGAVQKAQQLLNQTIQFSIDLNKEMTKVQVLQVEGAQTAEQIRSLALEYNKLGKELGATTLEVAQGSVEWLNL